MTRKQYITSLANSPLPKSLFDKENKPPLQPRSISDYDDAVLRGFKGTEKYYKSYKWDVEVEDKNSEKEDWDDKSEHVLGETAYATDLATKILADWILTVEWELESRILEKLNLSIETKSSETESELWNLRSILIEEKELSNKRINATNEKFDKKVSDAVNTIQSIKQLVEVDHSGKIDSLYNDISNVRQSFFNVLESKSNNGHKHQVEDIEWLVKRLKSIDDSVNDKTTFSEVQKALKDIYTKEETYSKTQVDSLVGDIKTWWSTILMNWWPDVPVTLAGLSANSTTAPNSLYQMTSGVPVEFRSSDNNPILYIDEATENVWFGTNTPTLAKLQIKSSTTSAVVGSEQITNVADRDFSSDTGNWTWTNWTIGSWVITHTAWANTLTLNNAALSAAPVSWLLYRVAFTVNTTVAGSLVCLIGSGGSSWPSFGRTVGSVTYTTNQIATGTNALKFIPDATWTGTIDNVSIKIITPIPNVIVGTNSSWSPRFTGRLTSWLYSTAYGNNSLNIATGNNTAFGYMAGHWVTTGTSSIFFWDFAGQYITTSTYVTAIGSNCMNFALTWTRCTAIGSNSLNVNNWWTDVMAIGDGSFQANVTWSYGVAIGSSAWLANTTWSYNNFIGGNSWRNNTTWAYNTTLGYYAQCPSATANGQLSIQNIIFWTGNTWTITTVSSWSIGIGTNAPDRRFHVEMNWSGTNAVEYATRFTNTTSWTATTGYGVGVEYELENASGTNRVAGTEEISYTDATNATEDAQYVIKLIRAGTLTTALTLSSLGALTITDSFTSSGTIQCWSSNAYRIWSRSAILSAADGTMYLTNNALNDFDRLQLGGTTSAFPSIQRSWTWLVARLADDSADTDITAAKVISTAVVRLKWYVVSELPEWVIWDTCYVTDATDPVWWTDVSWSWSVVVPVFYNGEKRIVA